METFVTVAYGSDYELFTIEYRKAGENQYVFQNGVSTYEFTNIRGHYFL